MQRRGGLGAIVTIGAFMTVAAAYQTKTAPRPLDILHALAASGRAQDTRYLAQVDHLVYATPDLDLGVATVERLLGVRATPGGQHPGFGTRNALVALGPSIYFEILGPDPEQPKPAGPRRFGIDALKEPTLIAWVARSTALEDLASRAAAKGIHLGTVMSGSRKRPDGTLLSWRYTDPSVVIEHRLIPYVMDWGTSPHPAETAPKGARLVALRLEDPDPARIERMLRDLGLNVPVVRGQQAMIVATIEGAKGRVEMRGAQ
jgi:hypothetical protein